ncbi:MAG TPA: ribonuclease H-like domain-containing protein [Bacillota bacterium]|nr:ribonuclease H-like domain-containing protein [Bacillota bacterium]
MEIKEKTTDIPIFSSAVYDFYFGGLNTAVFDIETTGLSPENSSVIMAGFFIPSQEGGIVRQYLAENLSEERDLISMILKEIKDLDVLITYNGKAFDIPFLKTRASHMGLHDLYLPYTLDIYKAVKDHSPIKSFLPNLKQKTLETFMGLWENRTDLISGKESAEMYFEYINNGDKKIKEKILLHNSDDVIQLYKLLSVTDKTDFHKAMYHLGYPIKKGFWSGIVSNISFSGQRLMVKGDQLDHPANYTCFAGEDNDYSSSFSSAKRKFTTEILLLNEKNYLFADLRKPSIRNENSENQFKSYPGYENGYIIIRKGSDINYGETNHLVKFILEGMVEKCII